MSGREQFQRLKGLINFLSGLMNLLPKKMQRKLFNHFRNTKGKKGMLFRYILLKNIAKKCGDNVLINEGVIIKNVDQISFGNNVSIQEYSYIEGKGGITIGNDVSIAHSCSILSTSHTFSKNDEPIKYQQIDSKPVFIKDNVWIGCKVTILYGIIIDSGSIVGANSVVTKDISKNTIYAGVPAKLIKERKS